MQVGGHHKAIFAAVRSRPAAILLPTPHEGRESDNNKNSLCYEVSRRDNKTRGGLIQAPQDMSKSPSRFMLAATTHHP